MSDADLDAEILQKIEAIARLETALAELSKAKVEDISGRVAARLALVSFHRFLVEAKFSPEAQGQIVELVTALEALDAGAVLSLVKPAVRHGGRPITEGERIPRAVAAAAMQLRYLELKKAGQKKPLNSAAEWVARKISDWPELPYSNGAEDPSKTDQRRITKWRAEIREAPNSDAAKLYEFLTTKSPYQTAKQLLETEPSQWGFSTKKSH